MKEFNFKIYYLVTVLCLPGFSTSAQKTPEELGRLAFEAFTKDSVVDISKLQSTFEEARLFTKKISLPFDSVGYYLRSEKLKKQAHIIKAYNEKGFNWVNAKLDTIIKTEFEFSLDWSKSDSRSVTLANIIVYFSMGNRHFLLRLQDNPKIDQLWKLGGSISFSEF